MNEINDEVYNSKHGIGKEDLLMPLQEQLNALGLQTKKTCCSSGYLQYALPYGMLPNGKHMAQVRRLVNTWVDEMIEQKIENFLCPMEPGADLMVAERVAARRSISHKPIRLIACLTHPDMKREIPLLFYDTFVSLCNKAQRVLFANDVSGGRQARSTVNLDLIKCSNHMLAVYQSTHVPIFLQDAKRMNVAVTHIQTDLLDRPKENL